MGEFSRSVSSPGAAIFPASKTKVIFTTLPPPDPTEESDRGLVVVVGSGAQVIDLSRSISVSASRSVKKETERTVDNVRVRNPDDPSQHVDVQRPAKVTVSPEGNVNVRAGGAEVTVYARQPPQENVEVVEQDVTIKNPDYGG